jgi:hypothetical protein
VTGIFWGDIGLSSGLGFGIEFFGGFGWGWGHRGCDWRSHRVVFNHNTYISHSRTITNRNIFRHANFNLGNFRNVNFNHGNVSHGNGFPREQCCGQKFRIPWVFTQSGSIRNPLRAALLLKFNIHATGTLPREALCDFKIQILDVE